MRNEYELPLALFFKIPSPIISPDSEFVSLQNDNDEYERRQECRCVMETNTCLLLLATCPGLFGTKYDILPPLKNFDTSVPANERNDLFYL